MAVLAKPINRIAVIKEKESQKFVREFTTVERKIVDRVHAGDPNPFQPAA